MQITQAIEQIMARVPDLTLTEEQLESPYPVASFLPTYEAAPVMVSW